MVANTAHGLRSALEEHLVAVLVVAMVVVAALAGYPALKSQAEGTATRAQTRMDRPFVEAYHLEHGVYPSSVPSESTSDSP